ncbi:hypothetical protein [Bradyrhizobium sp. WSM471]|uniref:hypothetical protein n=1 Tax=Bradyrhizobium sp. WSM471 TaxID=319017 RepID=UPI00024D1D71|nr:MULTISPECIES: hypothetical protein [Bradyrhizobium]EHR02144.1 hypothetical protein Bra471DRAFT_02892 [Bradyrhizobium sp. WSM471]UFW44158.1 hypothetical protein BcanWSM471_14190 [Bradyrhizobium canariense]
MVYVSMTGFRPKGVMQLPMFWWRTRSSFVQARRAPGNLLTAVRVIGGVYYTLTAWADPASMRRFVLAGAHLQATKSSSKLGTGWVFGYACDEIPDWDSVYELWKLHRREV